jgi:hypothetical protein
MQWRYKNLSQQTKIFLERSVFLSILKNMTRLKLTIETYKQPRRGFHPLRVVSRESGLGAFIAIIRGGLPPSRTRLSAARLHF